MTIIETSPVQQQTTATAGSGLTADQMPTVLAAVAHEVGTLSVQFRHATPFSPVRRHLREQLAALRAVLVQGDVAPANAAAVVEVLTARAGRLHTQQRHCDTPSFAEGLRAEQAVLTTAVDRLAAPAGT